MKRNFLLSLLALLALISGAAMAGIRPSLNGALQTVENGTTVAVASGAAIDVKNGGEVKFSDTYSGTSSYQPIWGDLTLAAAAGSTDGKFLAPFMGNVFGTNLTKAGNYIGGVIGHYSVDGTNASTYPVGAVLGGITDGTTTADGAFVAYIDGDSASTTARSGFKVMTNNSTASSGFDFGVDLQDAAHDGYAAVDEDFYLKAPMRLVKDVVFLVNDGAPVDGTSGSGAGNAGPGSLFFDTSGKKLYINTNTTASPTWTVVGTQS